ncbi:MAG: hypothetical protein BGO10_01690 [Chlamydia sp. 32-24]|nr:MAG: hypothetical protein BGO10_01690 [Chlamydia sp. 32-24]
MSISFNQFDPMQIETWEGIISPDSPTPMEMDWTNSSVENNNNITNNQSSNNTNTISNTNNSHNTNNNNQIATTYTVHLTTINNYFSPTASPLTSLPPSPEKSNSPENTPVTRDFSEATTMLNSRVEKVTSQQLNDIEDLFEDLESSHTPNLEHFRLFTTQSHLARPYGNGLLKIKKSISIPETIIETPDSYIVKSNKFFLTNMGKKVRKVTIYEKNNLNKHKTYVYKSIKNPGEKAFNNLSNEWQIIQIFKNTNLYPSTLYMTFNEEKIVSIQEKFGVDLFTLYENGSLNFDQKIEIAKQIIHHLNLTHSRNITHGDLKFENIVVKVDEKIKARLIDFELSLDHNEQDITENLRQATFDRAAPELFFSDPIDYKKADIWALGLILNDLFNSRPQYADVYQTAKAAMYSSEEKTAEFWEEIDRQFETPPQIDISESLVEHPRYAAFLNCYTKLLNRCFTFDSKKRASIQEVQHLFAELIRIYKGN